MLCRNEALALHSAREQLESNGIRLVAITHQNDQSEVSDFKSKYWPNAPLYQDPEMVFYSELGGGQLRYGNVLNLLNPFSRSFKAGQEASKNVKDWNLRGEGRILGGSFVITPSQVAYQFKESHFGERADVDDFINATSSASS